MAFGQFTPEDICGPKMGGGRFPVPAAIFQPDGARLDDPPPPRSFDSVFTPRPVSADAAERREGLEQPEGEVAERPG
ncbi:MAG TPA: hypothetical protein PK452_15000, partial [Amaricoccus sp.]|uniref:hypothetical protein n=1 Tax=Amaricoccus sp. TaxID=1872485 RepID=UPI002B5230DC